MVNRASSATCDRMSRIDPPAQLDPQRILVIRFGRLGDVVLLVPALRAMRKHWERAKIDVLVDHRYEAVPRMCSAVSEVLPINRLQMRDGNKLKAFMKILQIAETIRKRKYDLVLDFHSFRETNLLTWHSRARWRLGLKRVHSPYFSFCFNLGPVREDDNLHVSDIFLSLLAPFGICGDPNECLLDLPPFELGKAKEFTQVHQVPDDALMVGLNVGAGSLSRTWPKEKFARLAEKILKSHDGYIVLFSGPQEDDISQQISKLLRSNRVLQALNFPLPKLAAMISRCSILVSNDTGPMHLGAAVGVPTLGLFSIARPEHYRPLGRLSRYAKAASIEALEVEDVYEGFVRILELARAHRKSRPQTSPSRLTEFDCLEPKDQF